MSRCARRSRRQKIQSSGRLPESKRSKRRMGCSVTESLEFVPDLVMMRRSSPRTAHMLRSVTGNAVSLLPAPALAEKQTESSSQRDTTVADTTAIRPFQVKFSGRRTYGIASARDGDQVG
jgi:hypothetical protein